jgi:hypothetical protein
MSSPPQVPPDGPSDSEKEKQARDKFGSADKNRIFRTEAFWDYFDNVSKLIGGIAFVCWMIQEWILPSNRIFLFIAIVLGLADVFYLILHKFLHHNRTVIVFGWIVFAVIVVIIHRPRPPGRGVDLYFALAGQHGGLPLALTNDLFKFQMNADPYWTKPINVRGVIMIPLLRGVTSVTTEFVLKDISPNEIDRGSVKIILPLVEGTNKYIINSSWIEDRLASGPAIGYTFAMPYMAPGEFQSLPQLGFGLYDTPKDVFGVLTEPKDMDVQLWLMRICFIEVPWVAKPFVTFPQMIDNHNGILQFHPEFTVTTNPVTGEVTMAGVESSPLPVNSPQTTGKTDSSNAFAVILIFVIVALLIIFVVVYAIRA